MKTNELRIRNYIKYNNFIYDIWGLSIDKVVIDSELINSHLTIDVKYLQPIPLTEQWLLDFGFKKIPHFTIQNSMTLDIGRNRYLSIGGLGTRNEMMFLCERNNEDENKVNDLIVIHNYDYDGFLQVHKLQNILFDLANIDISIINE